MYHMEANASDVVTGVTISQQFQGDGLWHPIAFFSKSLSPVEQSYEIQGKEMLAIIHALEEWQHFWKVPGTSLRSGWTTRTWNTSGDE